MAQFALYLCGQRHVKPPMKLCLARHGETDWNAAGILQGWSDVLINDEGRRQAREMSVQLLTQRADSGCGCGFIQVWSSPLIRALETAQIIAAQWGLPAPQCHDGLKERHFGIIQGVPKSELAELNPVLLQQILKRNPATDFEGGETMDTFAVRVLAALEEIAGIARGVRVTAASADGCLLVISHGWVLDVLTRHIRGLPRSAMLGVKPKNGECLWLEVSHEGRIQALGG